MLHLVTGNPGAKKSAFVVSRLDKIETDNKVNLVSIKIDKWIKFYDRDLNTIAKFIVIIGLIGLTGLIISIINILRGIL